LDEGGGSTRGDGSASRTSLATVQTTAERLRWPAIVSLPRASPVWPLSGLALYHCPSPSKPSQSLLLSCCLRLHYGTRLLSCQSAEHSRLLLCWSRVWCVRDAGVCSLLLCSAREALSCAGGPRVYAPRCHSVKPLTSLTSSHSTLHSQPPPDLPLPSPTASAMREISLPRVTASFARTQSRRS
jgi:hypothetical protein